MEINEAQIRQVHATVRAYFKGKTKSSNKIYYMDDMPDLKMTPAMQKKVARRNENSMVASLKVPSLRESKAYAGLDGSAYGYEVLNQQDVIGNCVEMAAAAAYLVMRERIGVAWFVGICDPGDHAFCLVDNGVAAHPKSIAGYRICSADSWVIDPWANVCCRMQDYDAVFSAQMRKWQAQGKRIIVVRKGKDYALVMNPAKPDYMEGFRKGATVYIKASDNVPQGVPRALLRVLPDISEAPKTTRKNWQCVIL